MWPFKKKKDVEYKVTLLGDMQKVSLNQEDVLVISFPGRLSSEGIDRLGESFKKKFPMNKIIVLSEGLRIGVLADSYCVSTSDVPEHPSKEREEIPITLRGVSG